MTSIPLGVPPLITSKSVTTAARRQIEVYDSGPTLRYDRGPVEDDFGLLAQEPLAPLDEWQPWAITEAEFEQAWHDLP
ncbi:hypothetical protein StoSoilA2_11880 [Arthrobacter sp. StoSoilA2]|uniref:hypothetical protein n=1 Tax=Arthrobacter sp. StoSoilA2 TaxID=2830990 RepID=UPI001CC3C533|nr:hypothetical protein [Arthrobacter sp. StoSoilA2]BCW35132.1 hypothetical protein StoSoilA2_11880 [Arthrobacter sp. StoSoilA2]